MPEEIKKEIIIEILQKISGIWEIANGLIVLISSQYITQEAIDGLILIIKSSLKDFSDKEEIEQLENSLIKLQNLKNIEKKENINKEKELDLLKNMLDNI